jgi:methylated-DNA-[protein]-cysteine S-methyltransferase
MVFDKSEVFFTFHQTSLGRFALAASNKGLLKVSLPGTREEDFLLSFKDRIKMKSKNVILEMACTQLDEYLAGKRKNFTVPLDIENYGTKFQRDVWNVLKSIPYGKTLSYTDVAYKINKDGAVRAVGQANKANPIAIFIPCHRVIGKHNLGGYAGKSISNSSLKAKLLRIESAKKLEKFLNSQ